MVKPYANPRGHKSREEVLPHRDSRDTLTGGGPHSRAMNFYGKKGSPHQAMDDLLTQQTPDEADRMALPGFPST